MPLDFRTLWAGVNGDSGTLSPFDAVLVRTMPSGSLEQVVFRMDLLHDAAASGMPVLNPPRAVEACVDKYLTTARLARAGIPTPPTAVSQRSADALIAFEELGGDVVLKPLFGSEGRGMCRITDEE
ncbi:MAG: 30S ribosomal protein S6--L-glutamate ligase, partial [Gemmataceae bacterium]|nr:30S ribosomal protein S6--L-glutamate ligase [Gemmataceae bacterium]